MYPSFVESAALDLESLERLERDVLRITRLRAMPGTIVFAFSALGFTLATELGARFPTFSIWITLTSFVAGATRWWVMERCARAIATVGTGTPWRRAWEAMNYTCVALFGIHVAVAIHLLGVCTTTSVMMMATTAMAFGLAYSLSPRRRLMRSCAMVLLIPPLVATIGTGGPAKYAVAPLTVLLLLYVVFLGHRLGVEYWQSAIAQEQLVIGRDELLRSQRQTRDVIEKTPDAMGIFCGDELLFVNAAWTSSLGYTAAELIGKRFEDFVRVDDVARLRCLLAAPAGSVAPEELCVRRRDGASVTWEISPGAPLVYDGHEARPVVARDVTERNRLRARLLSSERLAAIGTLAAGVGHEINNPLTYVLANLEYAMNEMTGSAALGAAKTRELAELITEAWTGAERVRVIVRALRHFSCAEESESVAVDVHAAIDVAVKMTAAEVHHRASVVVVPSDVPRAVANEVKLGQVLVNLISNAAHAIGEGRAEHNEIRISTRTGEAGCTIIEIRDTGAGISPSNLPRIFDPFFTTKPPGVGSGLGLAVCHASIRSFGGEISVTSEVGRGTTFVIRLPAAPTSATLALPTTPVLVADGASSSRARIPWSTTMSV